MYKIKKVFSTFSEKTPKIPIINDKRKIKEQWTKWSIDKTLVGMKESAGAAIRRCFVNKFFLKMAQNSWENTCAGVSFLLILWSF